MAQYKLLEERFANASELGIRLERVAGLTLWEAHPVYKHQAESAIRSIPTRVDVVTLDPRTKEVRRYKTDAVTHYISPVEIVFECGCVCTV
jgi:hypothetical protein